MLRCPSCKRENGKVLIQDQISYRKCHHFVCGNCRTEFDFHKHNQLPENTQLELNYRAISKYQLLEGIEAMNKRVDTMTYEQKVARLKELDKKDKK